MLCFRAGAPNDAPYIGSVLSSVRPSRRNIAYACRNELEIPIDASACVVWKAMTDEIDTSMLRWPSLARQLRQSQPEQGRQWIGLSSQRREQCNGRATLYRQEREQGDWSGPLPSALSGSSGGYRCSRPGGSVGQPSSMVSP